MTNKILYIFLKNIKKDMQSVQSAAKEIPKQFNEQVQHANSVVQRHKMAFQSQSSSLSELQERLAHMELTLHDVTDRHAKEKKRRQELHNTLMVIRSKKNTELLLKLKHYNFYSR